MTHIAAFPTKKAFREAVESGKSVWLDDPAIINPRSGLVTDLIKTGDVFVTNHPRRSWFAHVTLRNGKAVVK